MTLPQINPEKETQKITQFIRNTLQEQGFTNVLLAVSGGIDSSTSLFILNKALPKEHIFTIHLPYFERMQTIQSLLQAAEIPEKNHKEISIKSSADEIIRTMQVDDGIRKGNIMARIRMIMIFDLAKQLNALVCGTENKSEYFLSYFTRFGDEASDFEPIKHLYKTQVYQLAKHLGVPEEIIKQKPSAGLWEGQTDEKEFGFSYEEGDKVLHQFFEHHIEMSELVKQFPNAEKIIAWAKKNEFKHKTPYAL